jgi:MFS family permease
VKPSHSNRYVLGLLFLINLLNFYDRQILAFVTEPVRLEWNLTDTQIGWMGTAFTLLYAAVGLPLGRLADTASRPRVLALGVGVWSVFTALTGLAWGYWSMFLARMGVGIGEASCSPASNSLIGDLFPPERRARAIGTFMLGLPIGILLSSVLSGLIARTYGWRMAFVVAMLPGLVLALLIARVRDPRAGVGPTHDTPMVQSRLAPFIELWRIPTLRWIVISGALHNFNAYAVNAFLPAYLMRYHGVSLAQASIAGGFTLGAVGIISLVGGGILADRARQRGAHARLQLGALSLFLSFPSILAALLLPKGAVLPFVALMGLGWMFFYVYYVTTYPAIHDVVRPGLRGTAMAVYFFWMYVLGGAFGTAILGMLSDRFAARAMVEEASAVMTETARASGLHEAFLIVPFIQLALALVLFMGSRTMKRDAVVATATGA